MKLTKNIFRFETYEISCSDYNTDGKLVETGTRLSFRLRLKHPLPIASYIISTIISEKDLGTRFRQLDNGEWFFTTTKSSLDIIFQKLQKDISLVFYLQYNDSCIRIKYDTCEVYEIYDPPIHQKETLPTKVFEILVNEWWRELNRFRKDKKGYTPPAPKEISWDEDDLTKEPVITIVRNTK